MFGILFLIVISISQINAQEELVDICAGEYSINCGDDLSLSGSNFNIDENGFVSFTGEQGKLIINQGKKNEIILEGNQGIKINPVTGEIKIVGGGAGLSINGKSFGNIASGTINLDTPSGGIFKADFYTNENIGNYNINGDEFKVPANSRFIYDSKTGYKLTDGTEINSLNSGVAVQIQGNNFILKDHKLSGILNFDERGNAFLKVEEGIERYGILYGGKIYQAAGTVSIDGVLYGGLPESTAPIYGVSIDGVSIKNINKDITAFKPADLPIFFDKDSVPAGQNEYVVIDSSKKFFAFKEPGLQTQVSDNRKVMIEFTKDNYLFGDLMDEKDNVLIKGQGVGGYLEITRSPGYPPIVKSKGSGGELHQDEAKFDFLGDDLIISRIDLPRYVEFKPGTVPMIVKNPGVIVGFIPGDDPNKIRNFYFVSDKGKVESLFAQREYLQGGKVVEEEYIKKLKETSEVTLADMSGLVEQANNPKFISAYEESKGADLYLKNIYANEAINPNKVLSEKVGKNFGKFINLQEQLESGAITQQQFAEDIKKLIKETGKDPSISWTELESSIGKPAQNIKKSIEIKMESYYYAGDSGKKYLERVLGANELKNLDNCIVGGENFNECFDRYYTHYGLLTDLCGKNNQYCPVLNAAKLFGVRF